METEKKTLIPKTILRKSSTTTKDFKTKKPDYLFGNPAFYMGSGEFGIPQSH